MTPTLQSAEHRLLAPAGLDIATLDRAFASLIAPGVDFGDLYFQHSRRESWTVEDGIVKDGAHSIEQGVGVRALSGEKAALAYSDDIRLDALLEAAGAARAIARTGQSGSHRALVARSAPALYPAIVFSLIGKEKYAYTIFWPGGSCFCWISFCA